MAVKKFNTRIQLKNDTGTNWSTSNLSLLAGEFGWDSSVNNFKIGAGSWNSLNYAIPVANGTEITSTISNNYVTFGIGSINGSKINALTGYTTTGIAGNVSANDDLLTAIAKVENKVDSAVGDAITGITMNGSPVTITNHVADIGSQVTTIGGASGAITLGTHLSMSQNELNVDATGTGTLATTGDITTAISSLDRTLVKTTQVTAATTTNGVKLVFNGAKQIDGLIESGDGTDNVQFSRVATTGSAEDVTITDTGDNFDATTVEAALAELAAADKTLVKDVQVNGTSIVGNDKIANLITETAYNSSSNKIATMADITSAVDAALVSEVTFKGVTSTLPSNPTNGDLWKASAEISIPAGSAGEGSAVTVKPGDAIVYKYSSEQGATGNGWYVIPSGDESFNDTWRPIFVNGTSFLGSGINTGDLNIKGGSSTRVTVTTDDDTSVHNTVIVEHGLVTAPTTPTATSRAQGDNVTLMTGITEDGYGHVTGYTTDTFTIPVVNTHSLSIGTEGAYNTYNPSVQGSTDQIVTIAGSGPISAKSSTGSATTITISHDGPGANGVDITAVTTPSALKVAYDTKGHITSSAALTAADVTATTGTYGGSSDVSTVQGALNNLTTAIAEGTNGKLSTSATGQAKTPNGQSMSDDIVLHDIAKTGNTDDLIQGLTILLDCGTATTNIDTPTA